MTTLYKHKKTGARIKVISEIDNGDCFMVEDQDGRLFYAYKLELEPDAQGTKRVKTFKRNRNRYFCKSNSNGQSKFYEP